MRQQEGGKCRIGCKKTGGDLFSIRVKNKYTNSYVELVDIGEEEMEQNARPELVKSVKNMEQYDRVILCYPIWWGTMPIYSFLESYNFSGKTVYACATHEGSGFGGSIQDIKKLCKGAEIKKGFSVYGRSVKTSDTKVKKLVKKIKA